MIRMLIVGCSFDIHSERRLCEEVQLNLVYRWFCRLGLEDPVPDHSTFSKNRQGRLHDSGLFRHVFKGVLRRCMSEGLVGGEGLAIDASIIKADTNRQRGVDASDDTDWCDPKVATRPVREYIAALDGQTIQSGTPATKISLTDLASRWTAAQGGPAFYAYSANYLIDLDVGIIVDSETTPAIRTEEVGATRTILYHTRNPDCAACDRKAVCCPNTPNRKIARSVHEAVRDYARALKETPAYRQSRRDRKKVEMSFAHLNRFLKLDRLRLCGMSGANDELLLATTAQNLRKMATMIWRPPKNDGISVPALRQIR